MPVGHMGLAHVQKKQQRLLVRHVLVLIIDPGELFSHLPGATRVKKPLKFGCEATAGFGGWIKPAHRSAAQGAISQPAEALDDRRALQQKLLPLLPGPTGVLPDETTWPT